MNALAQRNQATDSINAAGNQPPYCSMVFNAAQLQSVCFGNVDLEIELLHLGINDILASLADLKNERGTKTWKHSVHTIKGCAASIGGERLAEVAANIEQFGEDAYRDNLQELELRARDLHMAVTEHVQQLG